MSNDKKIVDSGIDIGMDNPALDEDKAELYGELHDHKTGEVIDEKKSNKEERKSEDEEETSKERYEKDMDARVVEVWYEFFKKYRYTNDDKNHFNSDDKVDLKYHTIPNMGVAYQVTSDYKYEDQIRTMQKRGSPLFAVDYGDITNTALLDKNTKLDRLMLGYQITNDYDIAKHSVKKAIVKILQESVLTAKFADFVEDNFVLNVINYDINKQIFELNSQDIPKFRRVEGIISRYDREKSVVILRTVFKCMNGHDNPSLGHIRLSKCTKRDCKATIIEEDVNKQIRDDFIYVTIQQRYDKLKAGVPDPPELNVLVQGTYLVEDIINRVGFGLYVAVDGVIALAERGKGNTGTLEIEASAIEVLPNQNLYRTRSNL